MVNEAQPIEQQPGAGAAPKRVAPDDQPPPPPERLGQLVPAVVGALAILVVLAVRGTADPLPPLAIFAFVAVLAAVVVAIVAMLPKRLVDIPGSTRVSAWMVAVRTAYLALAAAALYVVQEIVVARLGNDAVVQADALLALELLALLLIALFVAWPRSLATPAIRRPKRVQGAAADGGGSDAATDDGSSSLGNALGVLFGLGVALVVLAIALIIFAMQPGKTGLGAIGTGLAVGGGALGVGALLGLLFGIPRSLQSDQNNPAPAPETSTRRYRANTNLEEISDWLTKIIVGVSLTQLSEIQAQVGVLIDGVADGFGGTAEARAFVAGMLTMAVVAGFLAGYLLARLYLPRALLEADPEITRIATEKATAAATVNATAAAEKKVEEVASERLANQEDQIRADTEATRLVSLQLDAGAGAPEPPLAELSDAIKRASQPLRDIALQRASEQRSKYWMGKNPGDLLKMERTIPIFRALLEADPEHKHVIHGQLGFALKDKTEPDHQGAIEHLSEAISERNVNGETGWLFYEFNRALSRIRSEQGTPDEILADLCKAAGIDFIRDIIGKDEDTVAWLTAQNIEPARLREHCAGSGSTGEGQGGPGGAATGTQDAARAETGAGDGAAEATAAAERAAELAARGKVEAAEAAGAAAATADAADAAVEAVGEATTDAKSADKTTIDGPTTGTADRSPKKGDTSKPDKPLDEADV